MVEESGRLLFGCKDLCVGMHTGNWIMQQIMLTSSFSDICLIFSLILMALRKYLSCSGSCDLCFGSVNIWVKVTSTWRPLAMLSGLCKWHWLIWWTEGDEIWKMVSLGWKWGYVCGGCHQAGACHKSVYITTRHCRSRSVTLQRHHPHYPGNPWDLWNE